MANLAKCPGCLAERPRYVMYAILPPTHPMRKLGQNWAKIVWSETQEWPTEVDFSSSCPREAGQLEQVRCLDCNAKVAGRSIETMHDVAMRQILGRVRLESDAELIEFAKKLEPEDRIGPDFTIQTPTILLTRDQLIGYVQECERKLAELSPEGESLRGHDWDTMLRFIKEAEKADWHGWPCVVGDESEERLGLAVVELTPRGTFENRAGKAMQRRETFTPELRREICGLAYFWQLSHPERRFMIRQVADFRE